ncbi:single-stranded DNA-binding protein [Aerococcus viridans]|uniref:Single-stranded DNA-binding protein n=1 Tax=Aerococcus viridans TaxID=1377 RepID=A0A2N6UDK8_9LACT|nr:single-stranded DNA-binding protein [Aerococcus viridans]PMC79652.1 single-stranded DNA-binding protein [Aerococcus viridans]
MINNVVLVGRLTRDVDVRYTQSGVAVGSFSIAVERNFKNAQGERETDFINCVIWRKAAENFARFTRKGSLVGVEGSIQTRNYENNQGQRVYVTEILVDNFSLLEPKSVTESRPTSDNNSGFGGINNNNANNNSYNNQNADPFGGNSFNQNSSSFNNGNDNPFPSANDGSGSINVTDDDLPF